MSARSTGTPSAWQMYCCFSRDLSVRCSMLKEIPLLRAPEKRRTGIEIKPKVKCPDQTEDGIVPSLTYCDSTWSTTIRIQRFVFQTAIDFNHEPVTHPETAV